MKKTTYALKILFILPFIFFLISCNPIENDTKSASMLIVQEITGQDMDGNTSNFLESDVLFEDTQAGTTTIHADAAKATITAKLLAPLSLTGASVYNSITIDRYVVSYFRTDGKNTEGVDIPYSFEGNLSVLVDVDSSIEFSFVIVRAAAKAEPPLVNLQSGNMMASRC